MTATEYRICVSDTPAKLASEVTGLLAQGWELYGHPFGTGNGNGTLAVCQAMVKPASSQRPVVVAAAAVASVGAGGAAVKLAPARVAEPKPVSKPRPVVTPRPERPRLAITFRNLAAFLAVAIGGSFLGDCLVFRSGFYGQLLAPLGSTGSMERVLYAEIHRPPTGKREVLLLGNSRVGEGFWAKLANEYRPQDNYWFSNCAVPGSPARTWYYFVRDVDPHRNRYAAIAIPLEDYDDPDGTEDPAEGVSELLLDVNRLRLTDILPFTLSFKTGRSRFEALRGATFKGLVLQRDFYDLIENPSARLESAKSYREHGAGWFYTYGGNEHSLAGVSVDWANHRAIFPPTIPEATQQELTRLFFSEPQQHGYNRDYQARWLGALADLYRNSNTRIVIYQIPRNPAPRPTPLAHLAWTTVDKLRERPCVRIVNRHVFESLEKPELFFDYVHLNIPGRNLFSPLLADTVKSILK